MVLSHWDTVGKCALFPLILDIKSQNQFREPLGVNQYQYLRLIMEQYPNQTRLHPMLTIYNLKLKTFWNFECYKVVSCYSIKAYYVSLSFCSSLYHEDCA